MIKVKQTRRGAKVEISGYKGELQTELSSLFHGLIKKGVVTKAEIQECLELATMSEEELTEKIQEKQEEFRKMVDEISKKGFDLTKKGDKTND